MLKTNRLSGLITGACRSPSNSFLKFHRFLANGSGGSDGSKSPDDGESGGPVGTVLEPEMKVSHTGFESGDTSVKSIVDIREKLLDIKQPKKLKQPKLSDVTTEELLCAVDAVVDDLHQTDIVNKKKTKNDLIEKLVEFEKEKFDAATSAQYSELLSDKEFANLLVSLKDEQARPPPRAIALRRAKRAMLLLKREIFYQALQTNHSVKDARGIAERAAQIAETRAMEKHKLETEAYNEEEKKKKLAEFQKLEQENTFYSTAMQLASKMLYPDDASSSEPQIMPANAEHPDGNVRNIFDANHERLNIFESANISKLKVHCIERWQELDANAARVWNKSFGPRNGFEEMIELTEEGKMWPYPINNEYQLGEEENVGFHEHIFLEKYLDKYELPEDGPIAHFMELVCVGLSKNPYMTLTKKHAHLDWFANYFKEKEEELKYIDEDSVHSLSTNDSPHIAIS